MLMKQHQHPADTLENGVEVTVDLEEHPIEATADSVQDAKHPIEPTANLMEDTVEMVRGVRGWRMEVEVGLKSFS